MDLFFVCRFPSIICHTSISSSAQSLFSDNEVDLLPPLLEVVDNIVQEDEDDLDEDDEEDEMEDAFMDPIDIAATSSGSETSSGKIPAGLAISHQQQQQPPPPPPAPQLGLDNESSLVDLEQRLDRAVSEGLDRALSNFGAIARLVNERISTLGESNHDSPEKTDDS